MRLRFTDEQQALAAELKDYFAALMTPARHESLEAPGGDYGDGVAYREIVRQLGKDGWLALGWPTEYGGQGRSTLEQLIFMDEAALAGVPVPFLTLNTIGPTIMRHGTEAQKREYLPRIAGGELHFAIGYSEPGAGTDLASLKTRAVREDSNPDEYVVNGQKMWTSLIGYADYVWLAARTDPDAVRHRGLSVLVVPADAPGFSWTPVHTMAGPTTSATYYDNVRVPVEARIGAEHEGWALITNQLNHERVALTSAAPLRSSLDAVREWALENGRLDEEWVRTHLARVHAHAEVLRLMNLRVAASPELTAADASATKVYGTELSTEAYRLLMEVLGTAATVRSGSAGAVLRGRIERAHRAALILTFGGGTNEVQRDIIAAAGLRLPVGRR
jgi:alkylation response protein AidB-like acyl-CoA dehydrogenase